MTSPANERYVLTFKQMADIMHVLDCAREFIDPYVDVVDGSYGEPAPNKAMQLQHIIDETDTMLDGVLQSPVDVARVNNG